MWYYMRKRIDNKMTRRQMKQIKIYIDPLIKEGYMQLCKEYGSSVNEQLEIFITNQVSKWEKLKQKKNKMPMSIKEAMFFMSLNDNSESYINAINYLYDLKSEDL